MRCVRSDQPSIISERHCAPLGYFLISIQLFCSHKLFPADISYLCVSQAASIAGPTTPQLQPNSTDMVRRDMVRRTTPQLQPSSTDMVQGAIPMLEDTHTQARHETATETREAAPHRALNPSQATRGNRPVCGICGKSYAFTDALRRHLLATHSRSEIANRTPFITCTLCGALVHGKLGVRTHEARVHRNEATRNVVETAPHGDAGPLPLRGTHHQWRVRSANAHVGGASTRILRGTAHRWSASHPPKGVHPVTWPRCRTISFP